MEQGKSINFESVLIKTEIQTELPAPISDGVTQKNKKTNLKSSVNNNLFLCGVCRASVTFENFSQHKEAHRIEKRTCKECNLVCDTANTLKKHMKIHLPQHKGGQRCGFCKKVFASQSLLMIHKKIHAPEKPHRCKTCNKAFRYLDTLSSHEATHSRLSGFKCKKCNNTFTDTKLLKQHMELYGHNEHFVCQVCKNSFKTEQSLQTHLQSHKAHTYPCDFCKDVFDTPSKLNNHKKQIHPHHVCKVCKQIFRDAIKFRNHIEAESPSICSKNFRREKGNVLQRGRSEPSKTLFAKKKEATVTNHEPNNGLRLNQPDCMGLERIQVVHNQNYEIKNEEVIIKEEYDEQEMTEIVAEEINEDEFDKEIEETISIEKIMMKEEIIEINDDDVVCLDD